MQQTDQKTYIDANLVNAMVSATQDVLGTMANTQVVFKGVQAEQDYHASGDISAVIGILGEAGEGVVTLSFSLPLANILISRLLGISAQLLTSEDRCDGVGELVNMISGNAKAIISTNQNKIYKLTTPTVILGANHEVSHRPKNTPYLRVQFEAEETLFTLQVAFKQH